MHNESPKKLDIHSDDFLHSLMRKQLKLSSACAAAFLVVLLGLPLANYFWPELMATRIFGFTLTWFLLGIGFFPAVWCIAFFSSDVQLPGEAEAAKLEKRGEGREGEGRISSANHKKVPSLLAVRFTACQSNGDAIFRFGSVSRGSIAHDQSVHASVSRPGRLGGAALRPFATS
jgi:uncharacterized membrane protein (DUF485 family)